jgi:hypothetical protein
MGIRSWGKATPLWYCWYTGTLLTLVGCAAEGPDRSAHANAADVAKAALPVELNDPFGPNEVVRYLVEIGELQADRSLVEQAGSFQPSAEDIRSWAKDLDDQLLLEFEDEPITVGSDSPKIEVRAIKSMRLDHQQKCGPQLLDEDVNALIAARESQTWTWNGRLLGFDQMNDSSWYVISKPLVLRNGTLIYLTIEDLCRPFLCGHGWNMVLEHDSGKWDVSSCGFWYH